MSEVSRRFSKREQFSRPLITHVKSATTGKLQSRLGESSYVKRLSESFILQLTSSNLLGHDQLTVLRFLKTVQLAVVFDPDFIATASDLVKGDDLRQERLGWLLIAYWFLAVITHGLRR